MISYYIRFNDLDFSTQDHILDFIRDEIKKELQDECEEYMTTRANHETKNGVKYPEASWEDIAKTEYGFENDDEFEEFYDSQTDERIKAFKGVDILI